MQSLLNQKGLKNGYLGVGSLLNKYIKDTQDFYSDEIQITLKNLGAPLKTASDRSLSPDNEDLIIASLKGLGIVQYINSDSEDLIVQIIMDKSALQRIRAAALNTAKIYAQNPKVCKTMNNINLLVKNKSKHFISLLKLCFRSKKLVKVSSQT